MIEAAIIAVRLAQYAGAAVLFGSAVFFLYAPIENLPQAFARRARTLLAAAAALLAASSAAAVATQSVFFAGSVEAGLTLESLVAVTSQMDFGKAALARCAVALGALWALILLAPARRTWMLTAMLGAIAIASLAWLGHAGAGEGTAGRLLLASDIVHLLAAAGWLGALAVFAQLTFVAPASASERRSIHAALHRFSGIGSVLVAALLATGIVNLWMIVGPDEVLKIWQSPYGQLLLVKLGLFIAMLGLAALNRFRLTPAMARELGRVEPTPAALGALRWSVGLETSAGMAVLLLVSWLGTLSPLAS